MLIVCQQMISMKYQALFAFFKPGTELNNCEAFHQNSSAFMVNVFIIFLGGFVLSNDIGILIGCNRIDNRC